MKARSNASYVSKQLRLKNTHNLRHMKAPSARRISRGPSSIMNANLLVMKSRVRFVQLPLDPVGLVLIVLVLEVIRINGHDSVKIEKIELVIKRRS